MEPVDGCAGFWEHSGLCRCFVVANTAQQECRSTQYTLHKECDSKAFTNLYSRPPTGQSSRVKVDREWRDVQ